MEAAAIEMLGCECIVHLTQVAQSTLEELVEAQPIAEPAPLLVLEEPLSTDESEHCLVTNHPPLQERHSTSTVLGRRLLYSHHLIADSKRAAVQQWALELRLGGFSKIGWPGVIIVEGDELDCQEYVQRLQRLRWKHLVVRGEEQTEIGEGSSLDGMRQLPWGFEEFGSDAMSVLAQRCRECGVEELFLTCMKIYKRNDPEQPDGTPAEENASQGAKPNKQKKGKRNVRHKR